MSSAPTLASPSTSNPPNASSQSTANGNASSRPTMRASNQAKSNDSNRRQSPTDTASRRPPTQKAWTGSSNPLTQKSSTTMQPNGVAASFKSSPKISSPKDHALSDTQAHERLIFILGASFGLNVIIESKTGDVFEGLMAGCTAAAGTTRISLKMTKKTSADTTQANGTTTREAALTGLSPEHAITFDVREIADIQIPSFSMPESTRMPNGQFSSPNMRSKLNQSGSASKFQTDADISGNQTRGERTLQPWVPDAPENVNLSLDSGSAGEWDQFATNRQLFGAQSTYDENYYTTTLDRSSESYKKREANAARIAREIEGSQSTNMHLREERGHVAETDGDDEEAKYSGVKRDEATFPPLPIGGLNKYTPPARRAPTGQPTIPGAPVDPAIVSAQLSRPDSNKAKAQSHSQKQSTVAAENTPLAVADSTTTEESRDDANLQSESSESPEKQANPTDHTDGVENKVLQQFRQFAVAERQKLDEKKRAQASQDRTAKLNELLRFSRTFKLKSPVPNDLVGILAKDPHKQEAIIEKAKRETEDTATTTLPVPPPTEPGTRKADPQPTPMPDRQTFQRGRGGFQPGSGRGAAAQGMFPNRNNAIPQRPAHGQQERKPTQPHPIPAPIPIVGERLPPTGPMAEQAPLASPQRSNLQTPTSATSNSRFNLNVRAMEFRPNANAPMFNPSVSSNAPSSPSSVQRTESVSRAASPSAFFGTRKPKPASERPSLADNFNPIKKMKKEVAARKAGEKQAKAEDGGGSVKDYAANGGIPNAFQTQPRWTVRVENEQKTYVETFEKPPVPMMSPSQSRSGSTQQGPYQHQMPHMPGGPANVPQIATPQQPAHNGPQHFQQQYDDGQQRGHMQMGGPVFPSPSIQSRQPSAYGSPMVNPAQLAYGQQQFFGAGGGQMQIQMRQYAGNPNMMHPPGQMGAPMMVSQHSNGPYMHVSHQYNGQMPIYSPNPGHVYPQQNGYGSPSRAPVMMPQGSQQGHPHSQPMTYTVSNGPMPYGQPPQMGMMRGYQTQHYGGSPQHGYPQQRTMSSGYGQIPQKMMPGQYQGAPGPMNAPQQPAAFTQMEMGQEDGK